MHQVERFGDHAVLRLTITNLGDKDKWGAYLFGLYGFEGLRLVDSVNRKIYYPLRQENESGAAFGTSLFKSSLEPNISYNAHVYFPTLPEDLSRLTVLTPGSPGIYAGIPVVDGSEAGQPTAGAAEELPAWPLKGKVWRHSNDLVLRTEGDVQTTTSSGTEEKIGLRTDVLFAFDSARLSGKAKAVLDGVAEETRAKADPTRPPIVVTGHTDSKGTEPYNLTLSRQRASVVHKELAQRLGDDYRYKVAGLGESSPVAEEGGADDGQARSLNRRVDVSYQIKQHVPGATTSSSPGPHDNVIAEPAQFQQGDAFVAERTAEVGGVGYTLRVPHFYRDGAFLIVPFEFTRDKDLPAGQAGTLFNDARMGCISAFGDFSVLDHATKRTLRAVQIGKDTTTVPNCLSGTGGGDDGGVTVRSYVYLPAPAAQTVKVTFNAGPFGAIDDVPVD